MKNKENDVDTGVLWAPCSGEWSMCLLCLVWTIQLGRKVEGSACYVWSRHHRSRQSVRTRWPWKEEACPFFDRFSSLTVALALNRKWAVVWTVRRAYSKEQGQERQTVPTVPSLPFGGGPDFSRVEHWRLLFARWDPNSAEQTFCSFAGYSWAEFHLRFWSQQNNYKLWTFIFSRFYCTDQLNFEDTF